MTSFGLTLSITGLCLSRGHNRLIRDLSLTVEPGVAVSLTGANGVGKSSLLRTLAGFTPPESGQIAFFEEGAEVEPERAFASLIHMLGHQDALSPSRTVAQELEFQSGWFGGDIALAAPLGLEALMALQVRHLSAGQKRRLSCARLLMAPRPAWLLDEPTAPLDAAHRALLAGLMRTHLARGGLIIAAVHDPLPLETHSVHLERPAFEEVADV